MTTLAARVEAWPSGFFPYAAALVDDDLLRHWGAEHRTLATVSAAGGRQALVWLLARSKVEDWARPPATGAIHLSSRAQRGLGLRDLPADVRVDVPPRHHLMVGVPPVDRLPGPDEVDVHPDVQAALSGHRWAVLSAESGVAAVRLRPAARGTEVVRLPMALRVLLDVRERGTAVTLAPLPDDPAAGPAGSAAARGVRARLASAWAMIGAAVEAGLRLFLRAPPVAVRAVQAEPGDDAFAVVRISATTFPLLGVRPGDHVTVQWGDRRAVATALEHLSRSPGEADELHAHQWAEPTRDAERPAVAHLSAHLAAPLRATLGIPVSTVVVLRRRALPLVVRRVNELVVPVGGLLLAAATIRGLSPLLVAAGIVTVVALNLLPVRHPRPPSGRRP